MRRQYGFDFVEFLKFSRLFCGPVANTRANKFHKNTRRYWSAVELVKTSAPVSVKGLQITMDNDIKEEDWNLPPCKYEYLDHTADIQIHAWGDTLIEAFEQCANAMFHYMTEVDYIEMKESYYIEVEGHDMMSLLYNFLDELLFTFSAEPNYIARKVQIEKFDTTAFKIKAKGFGEEFQLGKHPQGTEVKAITFSNMQIHENEGKCEVFVILDI